MTPRKEPELADVAEKLAHGQHLTKADKKKIGALILGLLGTHGGSLYLGKGKADELAARVESLAEAQHKTALAVARLEGKVDAVLHTERQAPPSGQVPANVVLPK